MEPNITFQDYKELLKRRKWVLIIPTMLIVFASVIIAKILPPVYQSTSTILVEEQEILSDYVVSSVTGYAEKRIQNIKQRLMSSNRLINIIDQVGLYQDKREGSTMVKLAAAMKENIILEPISVEMVDRRTGRLTTAIIAFTISFQGTEIPEKVLKTTEVLTNLFLGANLEGRKKQVRETADFLEEEQNKIKEYLAEIDHKIAEFKAKNINLLPEVFQANTQALIDIERKIEQMKEQIRSLEEREGYLEVQLAGLPVNDGNDKYKRLNDLQIELAHLRTTYSDYYPDVISLKDEIAKMKNDVKSQNNEQEILPANPSYVILTSQLNSVRNNITSLEKQVIDLLKQKGLFSQRVEATPQVEEAYTPLIMKRKNAQIKYDDLTMKLMEAKVAQGLEKEQKGGRFALIEPARLPEDPIKPNRKAIALIGIVLGLGFSIGLVALIEFSDNAIYTIEDLARISKFPVLAEIPEIRIPREVKRVKHLKLPLLK